MQHTDKKRKADRADVATALQSSFATPATSSLSSSEETDSSPDEGHGLSSVALDYSSPEINLQS